MKKNNQAVVRGEPLTPEEILRIKEGDEELLAECLQQEKCGIPEEIES